MDKRYIAEREDSVVEKPPVLESCGNGVWCAPGARIIDRTGRKMLPIGRDGFVPAAQGSVVVDKTMLIADVLDSGYTVTLFCRPRRFGKTLNMTMMRAFFEMPNPSDPASGDCAPLFEGTEIWEAEDGRYRASQGAYPVVYASFNTVKKLDWETAYAAIRNVIALEYGRHAQQIAERGYDDGPLPAGAQGRLRWGVAFCGKRVRTACAWA